MSAARPPAAEASEVEFECISVGGKLRVVVASAGYLRGANCQFPRDIRRAGRRYVAPAAAVSLAQGPRGKYFYRVRASAVRELAPDPLRGLDLGAVRVFEDPSPECAVCMDAPKTEVFVPCGHFCCCRACVPGLRAKCPICRAAIAVAVGRELVG